MHARVWIEPDGSIKVTHFTGDAQQAIATLMQDGRVDPASTFFDVETSDDLKRALPPERGQRHKWRKHRTQDRIIVDPLVPDPPVPTPPVRP